MKIKELIEELSKYPDDEEVYLHIDGASSDTSFSYGSLDILAIREVAYWDDVDLKQVELEGYLKNCED